MVLTALFPLILLASGIPGAPGSPGRCSAESGAIRVALLELYTSEGCDSCPPADRWASALPGQGIGTERVVTLGLHVDYWDYLGWKDPFASSQYSTRQRSANQRNGARVLYTPQLMLNGKDFRRSASTDGLARRVAEINRQPAPARIRIELEAVEPRRIVATGTAAVPEAGSRPHAAAYLALYENHLETSVPAGENRGKRLRHDFVVRDLSGPYALGPDGVARFERSYRLQSSWKAGDLHLAIFVQDERTGEVLQALAVRNCKP